MSIQGINNAINASSLRLVQPPTQVTPVKPVQKVAPAQGGRVGRTAGDPYDFQSVRETQLPRMELTPAHHKLEKLRDLIAAKTDVPIYFEESAPGSSASAGTTSGSNPYARTYLKFPISAADRNAAATDAQIP